MRKISSKKDNKKINLMGRKNAKKYFDFNNINLILISDLRLDFRGG